MFEIFSTKKRSLRAAIFLFTGLVLVAGCKKPEDDLGLAVQPEEDRLNVTFIDSSSVVSYTVLEDSLRTSGLALNLLGSYTDPTIGFHEASIFTQMRLSAFLGTTDLDMTFVEVDSVVLSLKYGEHFYGNVDDLQRLRVYRVTEDLDGDSSYYSNSSVAFDATDLVELGSQVQELQPITPVVVGDDTLSSQLRLRLNPALGVELLSESNNGVLNDQDAFLSYFKGLHVFPDNNVPAPDYGGIFSFDLENGNSQMVIYYRITQPGLEDTLAFNIVIDENATRFSRFVHDYTGTPVEAQIASPSLGQQSIYMQAMAGLKGKIEFPHLDILADSGLTALNRAELVITVDDDLTGAYLPNSRLIVLVAPESGDGAGTFTADFFEGDAFFDGFWDIPTNSYRINLTRHLQNILNGNNPNTGLYLITVSSGVTANRTVLLGPEASADNMKLELIFTEY